MNISMNSYQTAITDELLSTLPQEVQDQLFDILNNVEFVKRLISPTRLRAKDKPRDERGRIIVDIVNPHILEDMDYFRPTALYYKKHGTFTHLRPNANPNSEFGKWIRQERDRCWNGYVREYDGEWITGYMYFYMNYCPIIQSKIRKGTKQADRIIDFPEMWEGIYWRFHYMEQARSGGIYNNFMGGNHGAELASRGKAFAYSQIVETPNGRKLWKDIMLGDSLFTPDGTITKVIDIPFDEEHDVYKMVFKDGRSVLTTKEHLWKVYKNGSMWDVLYSTDDIMNHNRITRFAIPKSHSVEYPHKEVPVPPYLLGLLLGDGSFTISTRNNAQFSSSVEDVNTYEELTGITFKPVSTSSQNWLIPYADIGNKLKELNLNDKVSPTKFIPDCYKYNDEYTRREILKGLLDTDGSVHVSGKPEFYTTSERLANDVVWICRSLGYIASIRKKPASYKKGGVKIQCKDCYIIYIQSDDKLFGLERKNKLCKIIGDKNLKQTISSNVKSIEFSHRERCKCVTVDKEDGMFLIGDFIPTHNSKSYSMASVLTHNFILGENETASDSAVSIVTAYQKEFLIKDGVLNKFVTMADFCAEHTQFPRKRLKASLQDMTWKMGYKDVELDIEKGTLNSVLGVSSKDDESKLRGKRAVYIGIEEFGTFLRLIDLYNVLLPSVQEGDYVFGLMYLQGTAGDNASDFAGAQEIMYNPHGYNMYALPNVYDKTNQGKKYFIFFFPGYINRKGCYDENGNSDVIAAIIEILQTRYRVKYNSTDPNTVIKTIAEVPITPAEAIVKTGVNMFPVTSLTERLGQLDSNPREYDDVFVGDLVLNKQGVVEFKPTSAQPIRDFPHKDNKMEGAIEILKLPEVNKATGKVFDNRYILGCLKEGEVVNTNSGFKKVEEVTLDDKLINIEGKESSIYNLQKYYNTDDVYEVKVSSILDPTTFSKEHPIYCCTPKRKYNSYGRVQKEGVPERYYEYNFDFKKVSELKIGDVVKSPILYKEEVIPTKYNDINIWYLLGVILGDGWVSSNGYNVHICFNKKEQWLVSKCKDIVENILHRKFTFNKERENALEYSFSHKEFNHYFSVYFGKGASNKHIDYSLKTVPYILRKNLILGYIDTDGSITNKSANIVSVSKTLLCDIQDWLFSLGIVSSVKVIRKAGTYKVVKNICNCKEKYQLNIGTEGLNVIKSWGIPSMKINNYSIINISNHNRKDVFVKDGYVYLKIKNISVKSYNGYVYNYECESHTFMCNYIPTHNCDPYDDDTSNTMSLGSIFVLDLWTDTIVAEYTGRPMLANDFYETCRLLCLFFNGRMNYENNKKGLFAYFSSMNCLYLLTDILDFLKDKEMVKGASYGNKAKGTNASLPINNYAKTLIRSWLLRPVEIISVVDDEEVVVTIPKLYTLRSRALIKELISYNSEGNFDRISALGMLMLLREDKMIMYKNDLGKGKEESDSSYLGNDVFFTNNYDIAFSKFSQK